MKNCITTAALLFAGTALSQAAVVAVFNIGGSSYMAEAKEGWTNVTVGTRSDEALNGSVGGISISSSGTLGAVGKGGSFTANSAEASGPYAIPDSLKNLANGVLGSGYSDLWGGAVNVWNAPSSPTTITISGLTANTSYEVYLLSARANSHTTTGYSATWSTAEGSPTGTWSVLTWGDSSVTTTTGSPTVQFDGDSNGKNGAIVKLEFTTSDAGSVTISSGSSAYFTLNGVVVSSVPEPSAFGLLAGLGALALVASRRRRK